VSKEALETVEAEGFMSYSIWNSPVFRMKCNFNIQISSLEFFLVMENSVETRKIEIEHETLKNLDTTRKWTMFLAIICFIFLGLFIVIGVIASTFLTAFNSGETGLGIPESLMFVIFLILIVICFFPILFLFRFSKHTSIAVQTLDKQELHKAFKNLKSYFVYFGVLMIIVLSFYIVVLIVAGTSMAFLKGLG
jgi:hypothetical protein